MLLVKKIKISIEYTDFLDVFLKESAIILFKHLDINEYVIYSELDKQPPYRPIYSLGSVKLETLKTYIKINLTNKFI